MEKPVLVNSVKYIVKDSADDEARHVLHHPGPVSDIVIGARLCTILTILFGGEWLIAFALEDGKPDPITSALGGVALASLIVRALLGIGMLVFEPNREVSEDFKSLVEQGRIVPKSEDK